MIEITYKNIKLVGITLSSMLTTMFNTKANLNVKELIRLIEILKVKIKFVLK